MKKRLLMLPLLSALFWGSCKDPTSQATWALTGEERDLRGAVCAFALCAAALILGSAYEINL